MTQQARADLKMIRDTAAKDLELVRAARSELDINRMIRKSRFFSEASLVDIPEFTTASEKAMIQMLNTMNPALVEFAETSRRAKLAEDLMVCDIDEFKTALYEAAQRGDLPFLDVASRVVRQRAFSTEQEAARAKSALITAKSQAVMPDVTECLAVIGEIERTHEDIGAEQMAVESGKTNSRVDYRTWLEKKRAAADKDGNEPDPDPSAAVTA